MMETKFMVLIDVSWMYDPEYDKYKEVFDVLPRRGLLNFVLTIPELPGSDEALYEYFNWLYTSHHGIDAKADHLFPLLDELSESFIDRVNRTIPRECETLSMHLIGWFNSRTIILSSDDSCKELFRNSTDKKVLSSIEMYSEYKKRMLEAVSSRIRIKKLIGY